MIRATLVVCGMVVAGLAMPAASAHDITYKGTVAAIEDRSIVVDVVDPTTKAVSEMTFDFDEETKFLRGDTLVTFDAAKIAAGENISVTIDHDLDETLAIVVRLDERA